MKIYREGEAPSELQIWMRYPFDGSDGASPSRFMVNSHLPHAKKKTIKLTNRFASAGVIKLLAIEGETNGKCPNGCFPDISLITQEFP